MTIQKAIQRQPLIRFFEIFNQPVQFSSVLLVVLVQPTHPSTSSSPSTTNDSVILIHLASAHIEQQRRLDGGDRRDKNRYVTYPSRPAPPRPIPSTKAIAFYRTPTIIALLLLLLVDLLNPLIWSFRCVTHTISIYS